LLRALSCATDTAIVPLAAKVFLAGIPLTPVSRIAGAIFYSATNPDPETSGCAWLLPDDGPVFLVPREEFKMGVYKMIDERANSLLKCVFHCLGFPFTNVRKEGRKASPMSYVFFEICCAYSRCRYCLRLLQRLEFGGKNTLSYNTFCIQVVAVSAWHVA
jgi:hypothetical protein